MSKQSYADEIRQVSQTLEKRLNAARRKFERAQLPEKVEALKEIAWLETRLKDLTARLSEMESRNAGDWSDMRKGLKADFDGVVDTLERLIARHT